VSQLSVLDLSPVGGHNTQAQAIRETLEVAKAAERLGYHRFWLAEHHNIEGLASPAPEILIAALTQATSTIRLGSGGVMLVNYSPLKVAEVFMELEALSPGRIDLGVGRALVADGRTGAALRSASSEAFPHYFALLNAWLLDAGGRTDRMGDPMSCLLPLVYLATLGRPADTPGIDHWARVGPPAVAHIFESDESRRQARGVGDWYRAVLGRDPDPDGLAYWSSMPADQALWGIITSPEAGCAAPAPTITDRVMAAFPESPEFAVRVARCESSLRPDAVGDSGDSLGLMQINWRAHSRTMTAAGIGRDDLLTVDGNLRAARIVYDEAVRAGRWGWAPWSCAR
jgi:hypothetical protein